MVYLASFTVNLRRHFHNKYSRYIECILIVIITTLVGNTFPNLREPDAKIINQLFLNESFSYYNEKSWTQPSVQVNLTIYIIAKFILTCIAIGLPIPCGLIVPMFALGAGVGRWLGEIFKHWHLSEVAGIYAMVSAAAVAAGTTQSISPGIIILELTGQMNQIIPVLTAVLFSLLYIYIYI